VKDQQPTTKAGRTAMTIEGIHPYYLRATTTHEGTGYPSLEAPRAALRFLLTQEQGKGGQTVEQKEGKWIVHQQPSGSVVIWLQDEAGRTVRLE
jgi:hypothetical protein